MFWHGLNGLLAEEMGGDEVFFMLIAGIITFVGVILWYSRLMRAFIFKRRPPFLTLLMVSPPLCFAILYFVLITWSDPVVRNDWRYILLFLLGGGAWIAAFAKFMPALGLSVPIDVLDGRNPAAAIATSGAMVGVITAYSLANIGEGPTIWTTIGPAVLATVALIVIWFIMDLVGGVADAITIERDVASGVRLAGFLIAAGLILGRSAAGDYESAEGTIRDFFQQSWPVVLLCIAAGIIQRILRPTPRVPAPPVITYGVAPALVYLAFAAGWVAYLGKW